VEWYNLDMVEEIMQPGDLVELSDDDGEPVSIGEDNGMAGRYFPVGTLCVYLGMNREWNRSRFAVDILIDGARGWVWQDEIKPATGATAADP
jgi:hypothetical protein